MKDSPAENHFSTIFPAKTPTSSFMRFLKKHDMEKKWIKDSFCIKTFEKNQILKQVFNNASDFESKFSKKSQIFSQLYTIRHFVNRKFYRVSDFETTFLPHIRFWTEISTTQQIFTWNWFWKIKLFGQFALKKSLFLVSLHR